MAHTAFALTSTVNHLSAIVDNVGGGSMGQLFQAIFGTADRGRQTALYLAWSEVVKGTNVPAPFSQMCGPANTLIGNPVAVQSLPHPYIAINQPIDCNALRHPLPEDVKKGGNPTLNAYERKLTQAAFELKESLMTRFDVITSQLLTTGAYVVDGPTIQTQSINFNRNPLHTGALLGGALWSAPATSTVTANLLAWDALLAANGATSGFDLILGANALAPFINHPDVKAQWQGCCDKVEGTRLLNPVGGERNSLILQGTVGNRRVWTSNASYFDVATGLQVPLIPIDRAIMVGNTKPYVSFSSIMQLEAGYEPLDYFVYQDDKDCNTVCLDSSPLLLMRNINATLCFKVV